MTEFTAYNATTHPIIKKEDDYNSIVDHAFEKPTDFIIRKDGSLYQAIYGKGKNQAGKIYLEDADFVNDLLEPTINTAPTSAPYTGLKIEVDSGIFECERKLTINRKGISLLGRTGGDDYSCGTIFQPTFNDANDYMIQLGGAGANSGINSLLQNIMLNASNASYTVRGIKVNEAPFFTLRNVRTLGDYMRQSLYSEKIYWGKIYDSFFTTKSADCIVFAGAGVNLINFINSWARVGQTTGSGYALIDCLGTLASLNWMGGALLGGGNPDGIHIESEECITFTFSQMWFEYLGVGIKNNFVELWQEGSVNLIAVYFLMVSTPWQLYTGNKLNYMGLNLGGYNGHGTVTGA